jgi:hypothetical protein
MEKGARGLPLTLTYFWKGHLAVGAGILISGYMLKSPGKLLKFSLSKPYTGPVIWEPDRSGHLASGVFKTPQVIPTCSQGYEYPLCA